MRACTDSLLQIVLSLGLKRITQGKLIVSQAQIHLLYSTVLLYDR